MKMISLALLALLTSAALAQNADVRIVGGKEVDLGPLVRWLAKPTGQRPLPHWKQLQVTAITGNVAGWPKCTVVKDDGTSATVLVNNLPTSVSSHFTDLTKATEQANALRARARSTSHDARVANATAPRGAAGNSTYVNNAMAERERANLMNVQSKEISAQALAASKKAADLSATKVRVLAMFTGRKYDELEVWDCGSKK